MIDSMTNLLDDFDDDFDVNLDDYFDISFKKNHRHTTPPFQMMIIAKTIRTFENLFPPTDSHTRLPTAT